MNTNTQQHETVSAQPENVRRQAGDVGDWIYMGDANIVYGGAYLNLKDDYENGYVSAVRVTDLDSGYGFDGAILIEKITILGIDDQSRIKSAMDCNGLTWDDLRGIDENSRKLAIAEA